MDRQQAHELLDQLAPLSSAQVVTTPAQKVRTSFLDDRCVLQGVHNRFGDFALFGCESARFGRGSVTHTLIREGLLIRGQGAKRSPARVI